MEQPHSREALLKRGHLHERHALLPAVAQNTDLVDSASLREQLLKPFAVADLTLQVRDMQSHRRLVDRQGLVGCEPK
jgi:hypothetical protein